jgi:hypothetical protein
VLKYLCFFIDFIWYLIHYFGCNLFKLDVDYRLFYNLNYTPSTLKVQSWREITSGDTRTEKVVYRWYRGWLLYTGGIEDDCFDWGSTEHWLKLSQKTPPSRIQLYCMIKSYIPLGIAGLHQREFVRWANTCHPNSKSSALCIVSCRVVLSPLKIKWSVVLQPAFVRETTPHAARTSRPFVKTLMDLSWRRLPTMLHLFA